MPPRVPKFALDTNESAERSIVMSPTAEHSSRRAETAERHSQSVALLTQNFDRNSTAMNCGHT